jgi:hypothetical protein
MGDMPDDPEEGSESTFKRASSMMDQWPQTEQEVEAMRNAVMAKEGLLISVFDILRNVPRRVLMVFKLNDLTRYCSFNLATWYYIDKLAQQESRPCVIYYSLKSKLLKDMLLNYSRVMIRFASSLLWLNTVQRQYGQMSDKPFLTA